MGKPVILWMLIICGFMELLKMIIDWPKYQGHIFLYAVVALLVWKHGI
jgi:hypothetical protein